MRLNTARLAMGEPRRYDGTTAPNPRLRMRYPVPANLLLPLLALLALAGIARGQDKPPRDQDEPIRLKADLVTVTASVADAQGRPIRSLTAVNFAVYEDGIKQKVAHFSSTEAPFTLLLLLDISGSTSSDVELMKSAARNFIRELRGEDRVGVIVFSGEVELISDLLRDTRAAVESAIDRVAPARGRDGHRFGPNTGTSFYDALYLAVEESPLKSAEGRKAIVCMSDGVDSTSKTGYAEVARLVESSEASVYFLELNTEQEVIDGLLKSPADPGYIMFSQRQIDRYWEERDRDSPERFRPRTAIPPPLRREIAGGLYRIARRELREVAARTGGRVYPVRSLTDLSGVYKQVAEELRSQYSIGYYPANDAHDGRWRAIRVEVNRSGASVRARSGYRAPAG